MSHQFGPKSSNLDEVVASKSLFTEVVHYDLLLTLPLEVVFDSSTNTGTSSGEKISYEQQNSEGSAKSESWETDKNLSDNELAIALEMEQHFLQDELCHANIRISELEILVNDLTDQLSEIHEPSDASDSIFEQEPDAAVTAKRTA